MKLPPVYVETLLCYRPIIIQVNDFFYAMRQNPKKDDRFQHGQLKGLLEEVGSLG